MILLFGMITSTLPMQIPSEQSALWQRATLEGLLVDAGLDEISGLAKSSHGPYLWAHNDSGDGAYLMLLDLHGALRARVALTMKEPYDNEDITIGPCSPAEREVNRRCIFLGDIGDNRHVRDVILIHQFEEPALPATPDDTTTYPTTLSPRQSIALTYPGGEAHDAEALMSDPRTGSLYLLTKPRSAAATLYKVPDAAFTAARGTLHELEPVSTAWIEHDNHSGRLVTAGEFSADGRCLLLRTYLEVLTYCKRAASDSWRGLLEEREPDRFTPPAMLQGESLAIDHSDHRIWLTSERRFSPIVSMRPLPSFRPSTGEDSTQKRRNR